MSKGIILIGPEKSGKTTIGKLLAESLGLPFHDLSMAAHHYRKNTPFDPSVRAKIFQNDGFAAVIKYMMPIRAHIVEQALNGYGGSVIEFGAFYSIYEDDNLLQRVQRAVSPYDKVILLLPCDDVERSARILQERSQIIYRGLDWNEYFIRHPANWRLARHVVYTKDQSPKETAAAVVALLDEQSKDIFLLGPVGVGKTTIGKILSSRLKLPAVSMDGLRRRYYAEIGYSRAEENRIEKISGSEGILDYWKQFDVHAIKRLLAEHRNCIVDFGAGQTVFENESDLAVIESLLSPYPNVFLLMPSPDVVESVALLQQRIRQRTSVRGIPLETYLITHPSNQALATEIVYTEGKTPEQIRDEILDNRSI